ncbi:MAG: phytanoyl-CoA dioxygenase family protein [Deltaproteobacteria bacterium]|nr:phytanoyl-CoA dioxygenase family protein [Deltaproteobacteria bacterium]
MTPALPRSLSLEPSAAWLEAYARDGAAVLRGVLDSGWVEFMRKAVDRALDAPSSISREYTADGRPGRYFGDFFLWRRDEDFQSFMADSPLPELASRILGSEHVFFFYDQLLVKEPGTAEETPWHHDLPYWPLRGTQIVSIWVPFDPATPETGTVTYVRGSHRWGKMFAPAAFGEGSGFAATYAEGGLEPLPDIANEVEAEGILVWSLEPGDILIHHPLTIHHARGNASSTTRRRGLALRYVGDDAVFDDRPGTFLESPHMKAYLPDLGLRDGDAFRGELFPRVWPR